MPLCEAISCSRLTRDVGEEGGATGGRNAPRPWVEASGTPSYKPFPERVRTICHKVVHTIKIVQNKMSNMYEYINAEKPMKYEHDPSRGPTTIVLPRSGAAVRKNYTMTILCAIRP
jgi:hypothetical protein